MKTRLARFNFYLFLLSLALAVGCKTGAEQKRGKAISTFRLHLEGNPGGTESIAVVEIAGTELYVNNTHFLDETSVTNAAVVETRDGGFAMRVQYDRHGTLVLGAVTTENRGRRLAIFTQYGVGKLEHSCWLAAPFGRPTTDGMLLFTPTATREETEQIVNGLNNVAKRVRKRNLF